MTDFKTIAEKLLELHENLQKENEELREACRMISNELIYLSPEIAEKYGETIDRLLGGEK